MKTYKTVKHMTLMYADVVHFKHVSSSLPQRQGCVHCIVGVMAVFIYLNTCPPQQSEPSLHFYRAWEAESQSEGWVWKDQANGSGKLQGAQGGALLLP